MNPNCCSLSSCPPESLPRPGRCCCCWCCSSCQNHWCSNWCPLSRWSARSFHCRKHSGRKCHPGFPGKHNHLPPEALPLPILPSISSLFLLSRFPVNLLHQPTISIRPLPPLPLNIALLSRTMNSSQSPFPSLERSLARGLARRRTGAVSRCATAQIVVLLFLFRGMIKSGPALPGSWSSPGVRISGDPSSSSGRSNGPWWVPGAQFVFSSPP